MSTKSSLSSDLDLVKEFEQLKLKQKLLIESLHKKKLSEESEQMIQLSNKVDFLVKIFKEAQNLDNTNTEFTQIEEKLNSLSDSMTAFEEKFTAFQEEISSKIDALSKRNISPSMSSSDNLDSSNTNLPPKPSFSTQKPVETQKNHSTSVLPDVDSKITTQSSSNESSSDVEIQKEKKKKWF